MTETDTPPDPRDVDDAELATEPAPPLPAGPSAEPNVLIEDESAEGGTNDPAGADRDVPAGEDYAGSGF